MHFMLHCLDKPDMLETRKATRPAHLDYVRGSGVMEFGKPLADDEGNPIGSIIIIEADNRKAAEDFAANDPYALAGIFESVTITRCLV